MCVLGLIWPLDRVSISDQISCHVSCCTYVSTTA